MSIKRIILFVLLVASSLLAQDMIKGTYSYTYGDSESLVEARQTCKDLALRQAIESYAIFIESSTKVQDFQLKEDIIETISAGYLTHIKILEQNEEGRNITMTVEAMVDSSAVQSVIANQVNQQGTTQISEGDTSEEVVQDVQTEEAEDLSSESESPFSAYKKRMSSVENLWKQEKYVEALYYLRKMDAEIEKQKSKKVGTYHWYLYLVTSKHTALVKEMIKNDYAAANQKKLSRAAVLKSIFNKSKDLRMALQGFDKLQNLTTKQKMVRKALNRRGQATLDAAKQKYGIKR